MKIQQLLEHHGVAINPFSQEDAQSDHIFQDHCAASIYHPAWDKVLGDYSNPSTSIVFGEKGSGKTAIRLQLLNALREHNQNSYLSRDLSGPPPQ
jgi:type II secretory pathway predicted ATPase ExeA